MTNTFQNIAGTTAVVAGLVLIGASFAHVGAPETTPEPTTHAIVSTPTPVTGNAGMRPCVTEDEVPTTGACYWDGGSNGKGRTYTVYSDGTIKYDTPGKLGS